MILLDIEMTLEVSVAANNNAFESGGSTLMMSLPTEQVFGRGTSHGSCLLGLFVGIADAATNVGIGGSGGLGVLGCLKSGTDMHIFVQDQVVEVGSLADIDGYLLSIVLLGYKT